MSESYEDYQKEYDNYLSRTRSFLSSTRSLSTLKECERLLREARRCATAMQGLAEVEGDATKIDEAKRRVEREVRPLSEEVHRALDEKRGGGLLSSGRDELFGGCSSGSGAGGYRAPTLENDLFGGQDLEAGGGDGGSGAASDTDRLIQDSERLLLESQALCADSEQIGATTLQTMGQQREQLYISSEYLEGARSSADQARRILREMSHRALRNKLFLYGVILALVFANGAVLYRMFTK